MSILPVLAPIILISVFCMDIPSCYFKMAAVMYRTWRAVWLSFDVNGVTGIGFIGWIFTTIVFLILKVYRNGLASMKEHWNEDIKNVLASAGIWWLLVFIYQLIVMLPEKFSGEQIHDFSQGVVVSIASNNNDNSLIGTGFWIDKKGYIMTCSDPQRADVVLNNSMFKIGVIFPPLLTGKMLTVAGGVGYTFGEIVYYDYETGIYIIRVYNNPFMRTQHMFAEAENKETHQKEGTTEKYWVPSLSNDIVNENSQLFLAALEPGEQGLPAINFIEGRIVRLGANLSSKKHLRIYTDMPFKTSYRGAPVLDTTKSIVGIVCSASETSSVLVPSQYILDAITKAKPKMT